MDEASDIGRDFNKLGRKALKWVEKNAGRIALAALGAATLALAATPWSETPAGRGVLAFLKALTAIVGLG